MTATPRKVIIDTDAGVDDAISLFLALAAHQDPNDPFEIVAITTLLGNTDVDHVCRNVFYVLDSAGVSGIPVYRGAASPLVYPFVPISDPYHGFDGFGDVEPSKMPKLSGTYKVEEEPAQLALPRLAREHKGQLTVLALGPLTNVAVALKVDPDFATNIKELYVMGGNIHAIGNTGPCTEWNFFVDPEAAFLVLSAPWNSNVVILPWETAKLCVRPLEWRRNVWGALKSKQMALLNLVEEPLLKRAKERFGMWISADPICTAALINPKIIVETFTKYCTVELHGRHTRAQMVVDHPQRTGKKHNVTIIEKIDMPGLEKMLMTAFHPSTFKQ